ncbi:MAG: hypothetical protein ACQEVA_20485 [Myxococcota bacterium]
MRLNPVLITFVIIATIAMGGCATGSPDSEANESSPPQAAQQPDQQDESSTRETNNTTTDEAAEADAEARDTPAQDESPQTTWPSADLPPQAGPVHQMLEAIYKPDAELFRDAFTSDVQASMADYGVEKAMKAWRDGMDDMLDDSEVDPNSLDYVYEGDDESGRIRVQYSGNHVGNIRVADTDEGWKISEK